MLPDLKLALRQLAKSPGFTVVAVLSLAIGIGASTAVFSVADGLLFKPLQVRNPNELIRFTWTTSPGGVRPKWEWHSEPIVDSPTGPSSVFSQATFDRFREDHTMLTDLFAFASYWSPNVSVDGQTEIAQRGQFVSGGYFRGLGVSMRRGRALVPEDDQPGAPPVAVISYDYWQKRFNGDLAAIGKRIMINRAPATIVGITARGFDGTLTEDYSIDVTVPLAMAPQIFSDRHAGLDTWWLCLMGRLKPGVSAEQARAILEGLFQATARDVLPKADVLPRLQVFDGSRHLSPAQRRDRGRTMIPVFGMVALVLLAAGANVANLLLARGATRRREIAVRLALGASRGRIVRLLLTESVLLALLGAAVGTLFATWGTRLLWAEGYSFALDRRVLGFATALAVLTGIVFGLAPAWRATRLDLNAEFQGGPRTLGRGARSRLSQTLLVLQVAISLVLLISAGLFVRSLHNLYAVDVGFNRTELLLFSLDARSAGYKDKTNQFDRLYRQVAERIGALPGVRSVSYSDIPVLNGWGSTPLKVTIPGLPPPPANDKGAANISVAPDFFQTLEQPMLLGRPFTRSDAERKATEVAIVNQAFVQHYFGGDNPLGRRIVVAPEFDAHEIVTGGGREIVGVVRNAKQTDVQEEPEPTVYLPLKSIDGYVHFVVRTAGDPLRAVPAVRRAVREIAPILALDEVRSQEQAVDLRLELERRMVRLASFFGLVALALASVGLYGLMAYAVVCRTSEIGVRMALGALPANVLWMILRESLLLVGVGVTLGLAASVAAVRVIQYQLYGLSPTDPLTFGAVVLLLGVVALLACLVPARRAARVDPMTALRTE
jgi:predicted permease